MALSYKYVLPGGGYAENSIVKEMFDDVKSYVDSFVPSGGAAPVDAQYVTLATDATLTKERVLTGTTSQITITDNGAGSTVVLSLPQDIANTSSPSFAGVKLRNGSGNTVTVNPKSSFSNYVLTMPADDGTSGQFLQTDGSGVLTWADVTTGVTDIHGTTLQVTVSATTGSVTLSLPQDIGTSSAPQFSQMLLSGGTSAADLTLKLHDSHNGLYADGASVLEVVVNSTIAAQWDFTTFQFWNTGPIQAGSFKFRDAAGLHPTVTITPPTGFTSYALVLPSDDGSPNQYLTTDGSGNLSWTNAAGTGTVNTGTANRLAYYAASTAVVSALGAITGNRAVVSNSSGLPIAATTTDTEIGYVNGVTSAIQTQIDGKASTALGNLASVAINASLLPSSDNAIDAGSSSKNYRSVYLKTSLIIQQTGVGTNAVTVAAPASVTSHTLTLPSAQGSASTLLQNDGSGNLSWVSVTAAGGATKALDNLASVAVNTSLLAGTDNSIDLGSTAKNWRSVYVSTSIKNGSTVLATATELGYLTGVTSALQTQINLLAPLASPNFTGLPVFVGSGNNIRIYGSSGTHQWDMYLNSTNLRFSDNTGAGVFVIDTDLSVVGDVYSTAFTDYSATSTIVGWTSFTTKHIFYKKIGKLVTVWFDLAGTSNSTSTTFTLPFTNTNSIYLYIPFLAGDNSGSIVMARSELPNNSSTLTLYSTAAAAAWTASNTKSCRGQFSFQTT